MVDAIGTREAANDRALARVLAATGAAAPVAPVAATASAPDVATTSGLAARLAARPPVDADRVAEIKRAVANGTFPIVPATVADRLLALRYEWMADDQG